MLGSGGEGVGCDQLGGVGVPDPTGHALWLSWPLWGLVSAVGMALLSAARCLLTRLVGMVVLGPTAQLG